MDNDRNLLPGATFAPHRRLSSERLAGVVFRVSVPDHELPVLVYMSPHAEVLFGVRPDPGLPAGGLGALIHPDDREAFWRAAAEAGQAQAMFRHEVRCTTASGELKWVQCVATPSPEGDGLLYDGFLFDVTEARQIEAEVHRLSVVVEQMGDALLVTDRRGVVQYVNPAFEAHLGYAREEIVGKTPRLLKSGVHDEAHYRRLWDTILAGRVYHGTMVNRHKDGHLVHEEKTVSPVRDESGKVVLFIATSRDLTAHLAAEAEARRAEERYRSFVENSSEGIFCLESDAPIPCDFPLAEQIEELRGSLRVVECNDACARLYGRARATDLLGEGLDRWLLPDGRDLGLLRELVESGYRVRDHESARLQGGEPRILRSSLSGVLEQGRLVRVWGVSHDVTAERRAEAALRAGNLELERRVAERTEALAQANEQLARLATEDALTGLANRRRFDATLALEVRRARRRQDTLTLVMCDVDHFKDYNDHFGHVEGDRCLTLVGGALRDMCRRAEDLAARYGGEEFAVILPGMPPDEATRLAARLRARLLELAIPHPTSRTAPTVTVSLGVVSAAVSGARDPRWFVQQADAALYQSKEAGRDRATVVGC
jgi:diguanylate cyclase (GGDEF)-like protein/PAS domain S-box-containing protein